VRAVSHDGGTIHENSGHAIRVLMRLLVGRPIGHAFGVEDHEVRCLTDDDSAAIGESEVICGQ
jgi:hypothetical protein